MNIYEFYKELRFSGLIPIPCGETKQPLKELKWGGKVKTEVHLKEISESLFNGITRVAITTGKVRDTDEFGSECIDFDIKNGETYPVWRELVKSIIPADIFDTLYIEESPSKGHHVIYNTKIPGANKKLAEWYHPTEKDDKGKPKKVAPIETRGTGGYVIVAPSTGYTKIQGDLCKLPLLSDEHRDVLIDAAKSFNKVVKEKIYAPITRKGAQQDGVFEDFNERFDFLSYMTVSKGWTIAWQKGSSYRLKRPGTKQESSATWNHVPNKLYLFTSGAAPLENERAYSPASVYCLFEYNGDYKAMCKELVRDGYGKKTIITRHEDKGDGIKTTIQTTVDLKVRKNIIQSARACNMAGLEIGFEVINSVCEKLGFFGNEGVELVKKIFHEIYEEEKSLHGFDKLTTAWKAVSLIKSKFKLRINEINETLEAQNSEGKWILVEAREIWLEISKIMDVRFEVVRLICSSPEISTPFNPFLEYFQSLTWDGRDEIGEMCKYIKVTEQEYHDLNFKKMLVRCIACGLGKEVNRFIWTYTSGQYKGKSKLIQFLVPKALSGYYTEEKPTDDKDGQIRLRENFFYNWEELQSSSMGDIRNMKAMISKSSVNQRNPYGEKSTKDIRRVNFFASTNEDAVLTDTENTRWLIFKIIDILWREYRENINIDNLWAQAYQLYASGFDYMPTMEELKMQAESNEQYEFHGSEEELLMTHYKPCGYNEGMVMTASDIVNKLSELVTRGSMKLSTISLGRILSKRGFKKQSNKITRITEYYLEPRSKSSPTAVPVNWQDSVEKEVAPF